MRLPKILAIAAFLIVGTALCFAADRRETSAPAAAADTQVLHGVDDAMLVPQIFIPPHGSQKHFDTRQWSQYFADDVCYNIHSLVVAEDDHTGVVHKVRESTCTRASRFQTKDADATREK